MNPRAFKLDPMIHRIMVLDPPPKIVYADIRNEGGGGHRRARRTLLIAGDEGRYGVRIIGRLG
jgi:hypothetical protein